MSRPCDGLTALWFPEPGHAGAETTRHAIRACCRCPHMDACLGAALRLPVRTPGVMGGHTPRELDVLRAAGVSAALPEPLRVEGGGVTSCGRPLGLDGPQLDLRDAAASGHLAAGHCDPTRIPGGSAGDSPPTNGAYL